LLIGLCLEHTTHLETAIARLDQRVDAVFAAHTSAAGASDVPFGRARDPLDTITGVGKRAAETILAEIGVDMTRFPTAGHLASWAGVAPGNNITGVKTRLGQDHHRRRVADRHPHPVRLGAATPTS
jgi:transposase